MEANDVSALVSSLFNEDDHSLVLKIFVQKPRDAANWLSRFLYGAPSTESVMEVIAKWGNVHVGLQINKHRLHFITPDGKTGIVVSSKLEKADRNALLLLYETDAGSRVSTLGSAKAALESVIRKYHKTPYDVVTHNCQDFVQDVMKAFSVSDAVQWQGGAFARYMEALKVDGYTERAWIASDGSKTPFPTHKQLDEWEAALPRGATDFSFRKALHRAFQVSGDDGFNCRFGLPTV